MTNITWPHTKTNPATIYVYQILIKYVANNEMQIAKHRPKKFQDSNSILYKWRKFPPNNNHDNSKVVVISILVN